MYRNYENRSDIARVHEIKLAEYLRIKYKWSYMVLMSDQHIRGTGPRTQTASDGEFISLDRFMYKDGHYILAEMKYKDVFGYRRDLKEWTCCIETYEIEDYVRFNQLKHFPMHVFFWIQGGFVEKAQKQSPSGIYWCCMDKLEKTIHHTHENRTYWLVSSFTKMDEIEDAEKIIGKT